MAAQAIQRPAHGVRRRGVRGLLVADHAVVRRRKTGAEMTPCAVPLPPVRDVGSRGRFIVAADTVVLPVADGAPLGVGPGVEPMTPRPPEVRMRSEEHTSELQSPTNLVC